MRVLACQRILRRPLMSTATGGCARHAERGNQCRRPGEETGPSPLDTGLPSCQIGNVSSRSIRSLGIAVPQGGFRCTPCWVVWMYFIELDKRRRRHATKAPKPRIAAPPGDGMTHAISSTPVMSRRCDPPIVVFCMRAAGVVTRRGRTRRDDDRPIFIKAAGSPGRR